MGVQTPDQAPIVMSPRLERLKMTCYCFHMTFTDISKGDLVIHIICYYAQKEPRRFLGQWLFPGLGQDEIGISIVKRTQNPTD